MKEYERGFTQEKALVVVRNRASEPEDVHRKAVLLMQLLPGALRLSARSAAACSRPRL